MDVYSVEDRECGDERDLPSGVCTSRADARERDRVWLDKWQAAVVESRASGQIDPLVQSRAEGLSRGVDAGGRSPPGRNVVPHVKSGAKSDGQAGDEAERIVEEVYKSNKVGIAVCYNSALKKDPLLRIQKADVTLRVGATGTVSDVTIPTLSGTELGNCLQKRIKAWRFPTTSSGIETHFPITFDS